MIVDDIVAARSAALARAKHDVSRSQLEQFPRYAEPRRGFVSALRRGHPAVIAEVKKASPSRGVIRADFDPIAIARSYAEGGAAAISVLTEEQFFQGHLSYLGAIRDVVTLPLLRKDFLTDPYQVVEARAWGADAILLIVAILDEARLRDLMSVAAELGLDALVEVHTEAELARAAAAGATAIGINNRDLRTFVTSLATAERLRPLVPAGAVAVAESGIDSAADVARLRAAGFEAFLVGESLMRASDPGRRLSELLGRRTR